MDALPKRPLGTTGKWVSVLGYGGAGLGGIYSENFDDEEGIRSVHKAFELGINFFDTSPYYGILKAEEVLGRALLDLPRSEIVLSTKVGRYGLEEFDFSAERVTASVNESMKRLNVDYLDVVQCHDIEFVSLDQVVQEAIPALVKLKKDGKIGSIGITGLPLKIYKYVLDRVEPGIVDVMITYCHHTLFDKTLIDDIPYLKSKGVGIINASPLALGLLSPKGPQSWHPGPPELKLVCKNAADLCAERGVSLAKLALMDAISCPDISTTLSSMLTVNEVSQNVNATLEALGIKKCASDTQDIEAQCMVDIKNVLQPVMNVTWRQGLLENN